MSKDYHHPPGSRWGVLFLVLIGTIAGLAYFASRENPSDVPEEVSGDVQVQPGKPSADVLPGKHQPPVALFGYKPHPNETRQFLSTLPQPKLRQAAPQLFAARGPPQDAFLYRALYKAYRDKFGTDWQVGRQGIGDCVSWGWAHACDIHLAIMYCQGDSADWRPVATESIYGGSRVEARGVSRGGYSDGSYGGAAAKWVRDYGLIFREAYPSVDLSAYSSRRAKDWGNYGNGGKDDAGALDREAQKSPVRTVALVSTFDEAAAAIQSGYPVPVCSGQGFASTRDAEGFCKASGSWSHCMCFIGVRHDRRGLLCLNSWGPTWVSGPKWPADMPDGSFWVDEATVNRMLRQNDSFSVSGYDGFPFRQLDHAAWVHRAKQDEPIYALAL
ncbi:hypothetical protein LOC68_09795 [Blastopirellula sp. JC732]|uniref:Uncharacterized protein n=1 Tax=Blastopirellula sediminis TaxID=2894196 RepID=A0A9X1SF41_9BACT|nr:hypothetical protein [Blastopirellula sediminis]MCC9608533.1 hypothetical protein [Blastopirellula sediminis]MCC9628690.1 hypothetical protein [Blastopirellula sediminis]